MVYGREVVCRCSTGECVAGKKQPPVGLQAAGEGKTLDRLHGQMQSIAGPGAPMSDKGKGRAIGERDCHRVVSGWSIDCTTLIWPDGWRCSGRRSDASVLALVWGIDRKISARHCKTSAEPMFC